MRIVKMNWFVKLITFNWPDAITLSPFGIYVKDGHFKPKTINHEKIHWRQQIEMLIIPFYLWYFMEWIIRLFNDYKISFEKEAYDNDDNLEYLETRKRFSWIKYI
jgi:hypothetical protein